MSIYVVTYLAKVSEFGATGLPESGPNEIRGRVKIQASSERQAEEMFWHMLEAEPHTLCEALDTSGWTEEYEDVKSAVEDCLRTDEDVSISAIERG